MMLPRDKKTNEEKPAVDLGVVHGRFQILHHDHLKYLLAGRARCRHLIVGITNPDPESTKNEASDPSRSAPTANPLTYYERLVMVRENLREAGVEQHDFSIVPLPINFPERIRHYVPHDATFFLTIYDDWGRHKLALLAKLGLKTEVLWEKPAAGKGISGSEIRRLLTTGGPWRHLVPAATAELLDLWDIADRLRRLE